MVLLGYRKVFSLLKNPLNSNANLKAAVAKHQKFFGESD